MSSANHPIAIVRTPGFDCFGAKTTARVYQRGDRFEVVTVRDFYDLDGDVIDYAFETVSFATRAEALAAVGAPAELAVAA